MQQKPSIDEDYSISDMESLIKSIKDRKSITDEQLAMDLGYNEKFIAQTKSRGKVSGKFVNQLKGYAARLQNAKEEKKGDIDFSQPVIQVVLNLSYIGKKNADSIDKMAATNQRNTEIIAALVSTMLPNSKLAEKLVASLSDQQPSDDFSVEDFLGGKSLDEILKQQQEAGKQKIKNK